MGEKNAPYFLFRPEIVFFFNKSEFKNKDGCSPLVINSYLCGFVCHTELICIISMSILPKGRFFTATQEPRLQFY